MDNEIIYKEIIAKLLNKEKLSEEQTNFLKKQGFQYVFEFQRRIEKRD